MNPVAIIAAIEGILQTVVQIAPSIEAGVTSLTPIAKAIYDNLVGGVAITQAQLDALEVQVDAAAAAIQAPLPPDDGTTST
jgi:hypothetical protein